VTFRPRLITAPLSAAPTRATSRRRVSVDTRDPSDRSRSRLPAAGWAGRPSSDRSASQRREAGPTTLSRHTTGVPSTALPLPSTQDRSITGVTVEPLWQSPLNPADGDRCDPPIRSGAANPERQHLKEKARSLLIERSGSLLFLHSFVD
jgi:hypothetical protein